jgi:hypothetical protein
MHGATIKKKKKKEKYTFLFTSQNLFLCPITSHLIYYKQFPYRPEWPRGFQEVKVPRFHDNGTGWW